MTSLVMNHTEVRFVTAVTAAGSVKFFASGVNFSKNTHFFVFFSLKLLKFSEIKGVKSLACKSGSVKVLTNFMSAFSVFVCFSKE